MSIPISYNELSREGVEAGEDWASFFHCGLETRWQTFGAVSSDL